MKLSSPAFAHGGQIPRRFTCDGEDISPPLAWSDVPAEARSLALVCRDPDAPSGDWYHWCIFDIPSRVNGLEEGHAAGAKPQAVNDFGKAEYGGPCPPHGHGPHRYHFTLYALDCESLRVSAKARCRAVEQAAKSRAIATADLVGWYER